MTHLLDHFEESLEAPWTDLKAPKLTQELKMIMDGRVLNPSQRRNRSMSLNSRARWIA